MKTIYLATDPNSWSGHKIREGKLGGAENFFYKLYGWLEEEGYMVCDPVLNPHWLRTPDLVIHSNSFNPNIAGSAHLLWAGSWHASVNDPRVDKVIVLSEFMKREMKCDRAIVIPAPYDKQLEQYRGFSKLRGRIVTTSNPNRWFEYAEPMVNLLAERGASCVWNYCGGNKLYGDGFGECHNFHTWKVGDVDMVYLGVLDRHDLYGLLSSAWLWVYPNFSDKSETFCVSMIEAAALGIPVILPKREPFISILPGALFVETWQEMVEEMVEILKFPGRVMSGCDTELYREDVVKAQLLKEIGEML